MRGAAGLSCDGAPMIDPRHEPEILLCIVMALAAMFGWGYCLGWALGGV